MNITPTQAQTIAAALLAYAREIVEYERQQAERHFVNYKYDRRCNCDDCRGVSKYPAHWSSIARRVLNNA